MRPIFDVLYPTPITTCNRNKGLSQIKVVISLLVDVLMGCPLSVQRLQPESATQQKIESQDSLPAIHRRMFIVQGLIGVGGFGEVLAATLQQTGKWYALKVVNKVST
jgi:serine/threonine protein kinase